VCDASSFKSEKSQQLQGFDRVPLHWLAASRTCLGLTTAAASFRPIIIALLQPPVIQAHSSVVRMGMQEQFPSGKAWGLLQASGIIAAQASVGTHA